MVKAKVKSGTCRICGCTDADCRRCIKRTGGPCEWVDKAHTICSAHPDNAVVREFLRKADPRDVDFGEGVISE